VWAHNSYIREYSHKLNPIALTGRGGQKARETSGLRTCRPVVPSQREIPSTRLRLSEKSLPKGQSVAIEEVS
jgi:hypothetical protein